MSMLQTMLGRSGSAVAWDPAFKTANAVLSNNNRTLGSTVSANQHARSLTSKSSGKVYAEAILGNSAPGNEGMGICNASWTTASAAGFDVNSIAWLWNTAIAHVYYNSAVVASPAAITAAGDLAQYAIDITGQLLYLGKNNTWLVGDPVAGTGGLSLVNLGSGPLWLVGRVSDTPDTFSIQANPTGTIPTGYTKWT